MRRSILSAGLAAALLTGCAAQQAERPEVDAEGVANPEVALQRSLTRVQKAMRDLDATRAGARPVVPAELQRPLTWKWRGPLDDAARVLADHAGFTYTPPAAGAPLPTVTIDARDTPLVDVLRSIGTQAGAAATLTVDPARRSIGVNRNG